MSSVLVAWVEAVEGRPAEDRAALESALAAAVASARSAWPQLTLSDEAFVRHLARHLRDPSGQRQPIERLHAADLFLAAACVAVDLAAVVIFERDYLSRVPDMVSRVERAPAAVDELVQSLRVALLTGEAPSLGKYSGRGPLSGWLRAVALNAALMTKRRAREAPDAHGDLSEKAIAGKLDLESELLKKRHRADFQLSLDGALRALTARERNLLRAYFVDEMTIDQLAARFRVHRATAARWVQAAQTRLLDETRRFMSERVALTRSEFDSLALMMKSELSLSFARR